MNTGGGAGNYAQPVVPQQTSAPAASGTPVTSPINHVSALTPPSITDASVQSAAEIARQAAAKAVGRVATIASGPQGDTSQATVTKKTLLGSN